MLVSFHRLTILGFIVSMLGVCPGATAAEDTLAAGFAAPPNSAKPHTWWHWMYGNVTREGITADLEAMKSAGIGGAQLFHVSEHIPPGPVGYMSAQWREMVAHAVKEAGRVGIELCMHNCAGWSSSGGPWITPEHAMQVVAWSEKTVKGPVRFAETLPQPKAPQVVRDVPYHRDIAVLACPVPPGGDKPIPAKELLGRTGVERKDRLEPDVSPSPRAAISSASIVVLTEKMDESGRLTWDVPAGEWTILRIGYTPTGKTNHPAPPEGEGLEVDKLSREALDVHWNGMMAKVIADAGPLAGKALNNALIDSYEVGCQNWTPKFRGEFLKRRGYDLLRYLPVVTGRIVGSSEESERFLWDFRRTIADLFADNYFGYFGELCHKHGMLFSTEPYGNGGFDNIQCGGLADIPMGEFWVGGATVETLKLASSVAHTYGRRIVGAESFTAGEDRGRYLVEPAGIKALGDLVFCHGINRYIFHRYAHQPWLNLRPGMTMGRWGMHLERTITWWNEAAEWFRYIARCQYLLQEGTFVADALYYYGEGAPNDLQYRPYLRPALPDGYDYDGCDAGTLLERMSVRDGRIVLRDGMSYAVLVLPDSVFMTPAVGEKIRALVRDGATVVGPKPRQSPSLAGYPACDAAVRAVADEVWGDVDGKKVTEHALGRGRVAWGRPLDEIFADLKTPPDFAYTGSTSHTKLAYIHRRTADADIYFVSNQRAGVASADCRFRVSGRAPELWHADTGRMAPAPVYREEDGRTVVPLRFDPAESVFVVFRRPAAGAHITEIVRAAPTGEAPETTPAIAIRHARYEPVRSRFADVTRSIGQMVAAGTYDIPVSNDLFGDPAQDELKQLRARYMLDGRIMETTTPENETLRLMKGASPAPPAVKILSARYQTADGKGKDIIKAVAQMVSGGIYDIPVSNDLFDDPVYGELKRLRVEYELHGLPVTRTAFEGQTLSLLGPSPNPAVAVRRARYESPDGRGADVTTHVAQLASEGCVDIPAVNELFGDPASDAAKRLRVDYELHGAPVSKTADEKGVLRLIEAAGKSRVFLLEARYEPIDGPGADVTRKVAELVAAGQYEIVASNETFGDPAPKAVKQLRVKYEIDGVPVERTVGENETLALSSSAGLPPYEVLVEGGAPVLVPWQRGNYELRGSGGAARTVGVAESPRTLEIAGPWKLAFPAGLGAPESVVLEQLLSWSEHPTSGVRYFSGTAVYTVEFDVPAEMAGAARAVVLDLGQVKNFATVRLNGKDLGVLWKPPFRVNAGEAVKAGRNTLEVRVTNLWPNRLIGDEQLPADVEWKGSPLKTWPDWLREGKPRDSGRIAFTTWRFYTKESPLLESGLLGPVVLRSAEKVRLAAE